MMELFGDIAQQVQNLDPKDLMLVVKSVASVVVTISGIIAACVIIYGGFLFITGIGDSSKISKGKNCVLGGAIGLVICLVAYAIVNFILGALK